MGCVIGGIGILSIAASGVAFIGAFLLLFGVGCAITTVSYPILTTSLFGNRDYSSIYGIVNVANSVGTAILVPPLPLPSLTARAAMHRPGIWPQQC